MPASRGECFACNADARKTRRASVTARIAATSCPSPSLSSLSETGEDEERALGACIHAERLQPPEDEEEVNAYGDGSGGAHSADWR